MRFPSAIIGLYLLSIIGCKDGVENRSLQKPEFGEEAHVTFSNAAYVRIDWLSVGYKGPDLSNLDSTSSNYQDEVARTHFEADTANLSLQAGAGYSFVNDSGFPVHNRYRRLPLSHKDSSSLLRILATAKRGGSGTACIYYFRDALVFYNAKNNPVAWIEICLECHEARFYPSASYLDCTIGTECNNELMTFMEKLKERSASQPTRLAR